MFDSNRRQGIPQVTVAKKKKKKKKKAGDFARNSEKLQKGQNLTGFAHKTKTEESF